jgi:hypothetical protein
VYTVLLFTLQVALLFIQVISGTTVPNREMTGKFVEKAKNAEPVAIVTEASNMTGTCVSNETEVQSKLNIIVSCADGIILAEFGY